MFAAAGYTANIDLRGELDAHFRYNGFEFLGGSESGGQLLIIMEKLCVWHRRLNCTVDELYHHMISQAHIERDARFPKQGELEEFLKSSRLGLPRTTCLELLANYLNVEIYVISFTDTGTFHMYQVMPQKHIPIVTTFHLGCINGCYYYPVVKINAFGLPHRPVSGEQTAKDDAVRRQDDFFTLAKKIDDQSHVKMRMKESIDEVRAAIGKI
jgi:hypothetical protein